MTTAAQDPRHSRRDQERGGNLLGRGWGGRKRSFKCRWWEKKKQGNSEKVMREPQLRKEARIESEGYGKKGVTTLRLARVTGKILFHISMKQSLHYFFLGFCVLIYRTVQCEDACIVVSVCRFSRQSHHLLSACLIAQWLLKACSNIPSYTRSHRMPRYTTRRWGAIQHAISWNSRETTLFGGNLDLSQRFCIEPLQSDLNITILQLFA